MRLAVFEAMAISLWRDRPAFFLAFLLPPVIFAIFAAAFAGASGASLTIKLAVLASEDETARELVTELRASPEIAALIEAASAAELSAIVERGKADAGLEIIDIDDRRAPDFRLLRNGAREAAAMTAEKALARLEPGAEEARESVLVRENATPANADAPMAAYYAAGVAMLFLFLSGFQSALTLHEERDAGVMERIAAGAEGFGPVIDGKFAFIFAQGLAQTGVIFLAARIFFGVELSHAPGVLLGAMLAGAFCAAGIVLGVTVLCRSRAQAHAVGAVLSLVLGAVGGSMAPAFLMPDRMEAIGAASPIGLGMGAFAPALWAGGGLESAAPALAGLIAFGLAGLATARLAAPRALAGDQ